jgi:hypothetical protein
LDTIHSVFLCLVSNVTRVYLSVSCVQCKTCLSFCVLSPMLLVSVFLCLLSNVIRVYLSVSCVQCYPCLSFYVLCLMLPVSIFLCLLSNVSRVFLSVSCVLCFPFLSFCVLCLLFPVLKDRHGQLWKQDTERQIRVTLDTGHRKIDTGNIGHKTQKDRHG